MTEKLKYVEIEPVRREELEAAFAGTDEDAICNAMWAAAQFEPDWRWTQAKLLEFLEHRSLLIRSVALMALGELVLFGGQIDLELVLPAVRKLAAEPALAQFVENCVSDIMSRTTIH